jgi:hypothetical protein
MSIRVECVAGVTMECIAGVEMGMTIIFIPALIHLILDFD